MMDSQSAVIRNLKDAGCDELTLKNFLNYRFRGKREDGIRLLRQHRRVLLDEVHATQKKIDCLDYFLFRLMQETKIIDSTPEHK